MLGDPLHPQIFGSRSDAITSNAMALEIMHIFTAMRIWLMEECDYAK